MCETDVTRVWQLLNTRQIDAVIEFWPDDITNTPIMQSSAYKDGGAVGAERSDVWFTQAALVAMNSSLGDYRGWQSPAAQALVNGQFILPSSTWASNDSSILMSNNISLTVGGVAIACRRAKLVTHDCVQVVPLTSTEDVYGALLSRVNSSQGIVFHDRSPSPLELLV
jgi:hypothetical protein